MGGSQPRSRVAVARTASSDAQQGSPLPAPQAIPRHWLGGLLLSQAQALVGPGDRLVGAHFCLIRALAGSYKELVPVSPLPSGCCQRPAPLGVPTGLDYSHPSPGPEWSYAGVLELSSKLETPSGRPWLTLCSGENPQASLQDPTKSVGDGALG